MPFSSSIIIKLRRRKDNETLLMKEMGVQRMGKDEKITAVYLMVRKSELTPEDGDSYERPLQKQKEIIVETMKNRWGIELDENVQFYRSRRDLFMDVERHKVKRLVVYSIDRLGSSREEIDGILFELGAEGIELLTVE
jgi:DNA invertase Pin-like site-specific DNA recombinase